MAPTLPPEIWLRIAQFIPRSILLKLYSVNSVFLDLSLKASFNHITFALEWRENTAKKIEHVM
jgi:hypothetical protein